MFQYWVGDYDYAFAEAISGQSGALLSMSLPLYYSPSPTTPPPTPTTRFIRSVQPMNCSQTIFQPLLGG